MDTHVRGRRSGSGGDGRTDNTGRGSVADEVRPTALFRHKQEGISGIYPMSMPSHWSDMEDYNKMD
jgi:hypothetical protein